MAKDKDKDKQLLKQGTGDDRAITFQRAVFIVCNLKRLIKRPKKDDKQSGSRKRSGHLAGADLDRGRRGRRSGKEPVRRAFTLPSVMCTGVLARLLAPDGPECRLTANKDGPLVIGIEEGSAMCVSGLTAPLAGGPHQHQHHPDAGAAGAEPLSECPVLGPCMVTGSGSFGRASTSGLTYLATPVRRLNQSLTGGARSPAYLQTDRTQRPATGLNDQPLNQEQLICPIWAHVMDQLDTLQGRSSAAAAAALGSADERQLPKHRPTRLEAESHPHPVHQQHQQHQTQVQVRVEVVAGGQPRRVSTDECAGGGSRRRSSRDAHDSASPSPSPSSDLCCYTALQNPLELAETTWKSSSRQALDSLDCQQPPISTSSAKYNRKKHNQQPSTAGTRSTGQQPMKRFSSALCLADHLAGAQTTSGPNSKGDISPDDTQTNLDQQALFAAVERNQLDEARAILERGSADVNRLTQDKLTCLDMAILQRNMKMVRLLQQHGAQESFPQMTREARANQLHALYAEARRTVEDLSRSLGAFSSITDPLPASHQSDNSAGPTNSAAPDPLASSTLVESASSTGQQSQGQPQLMLATGSILSSALLEEKHLQLQCWRRRLDLFMHMRYELERLQVPSVPELVVLQVVGENSLGLKIVHSLQTATNNIKGCPNSRGCMTPGGLASRLQAPPARLNCLRDPGCSHWLLDELVLWQPGCDYQLPGNLERISEGAGNQKLAAFNQLLAQQLEQLQSSNAKTDNFMSGEEQLCSHGNTGQVTKTKTDGPTTAQTSNNSASRRLLTQLSSGACEGGSRRQDLVDQTSLAYQLISFAPEVRGQRNLAPAVPSQSSIITKYLIEWAVEDEQAAGNNSLAMQATTSGSYDCFRTAGSLIIHNSSCGTEQNQHPLKCRIENLESGRRYRVRVAAGNQAGFSKAQASSPRALAPSGWRQLDNLRRRHQDDEEIFRKFTKLFLLNKHLLDERHTGPVATASKSSLINMLMLDATSIPGSTSTGLTTANARINQHNNYHLHHNQLHLETGACSSPVKPPASLHLTTTSSTPGSVRKNLKNFFQTNSFKFQKLTNQNKRGLYLAAIVFTPATTTTTTSVKSNSPNDKLAERVVVTNDERLPIVEISNELVTPAALMGDFYWLLKINGAQWVDIKQLRQQLQRSHSSSNLHLRIKLLNAIEQLQIALNLNDIGHLFYRPIQAHDGSQVICTCKQVSSTKQVNGLSTKWMQLDKILPRHLRKISDSFKRRQSNQPSSSKPCPPVKPESLKMIPAGSECCPQNQQQVPFLTKRRPTMASNSSNSSLASSGGDGASGHWSQQTASVENRTSGSSFQSGCNQTVLPRHLITVNRNSSGRSASLMVTPQTLPVGTGSFLTAASQQQTNQLARHSQPATACVDTTSAYLMQSSLSIYDLLLYTVQEILHFYFSSRKPLNGGLYLGFLQLQTTVESMRLLVPRARPNMVPCSRIRDNPHVSREEWALLRGFANSSGSDLSRAPVIVSTGLTTSQHLINQCGTSNRSSDPSIWSAKDAEAGDLVKESEDYSQRNRAKSISSSYLLQQHQHEKKLLSVSSEHLGSGLFLKPGGDSGGGGAMGAGKGAYSDTELSAVEESASAQLRFCQVAPSTSLFSAEVASGGQRRNSSGSHVGPRAGWRTRTGSYVGPNPDVPEHSFLRLIAATAQRLLADLKSQLPQVVSADNGRLCSVLGALNDQSSNRIYHTELIELSEQVAVILLLPAPENVCPVTSQDNLNCLADNKDYMFLPLQMFETIHISTYECDLLGKYSRLSTILETDLVVAQHDHRQAFSNNELKSTKSRVIHLQDMVSMADEFWRKLRWIVDVVAFARDKSNTMASQSGGTIRLGTIWRYLELSGPHSIPFWDSASLNQYQQQQQQPHWRSSCGCLVELEEPAGPHMRLSGVSGSNQHLPELILNDSGRSSEPRYADAQDTPEDEDEEAIYAYHVSLKDATRRAAAARRRGSQLQVTGALGEHARSMGVPSMVQQAPTGQQWHSTATNTVKSAGDGEQAERPHQLSKDLKSASCLAAEFVGRESLADGVSGRVLKGVSARGQVLEVNPVNLPPLAASSCWPEVMQSSPVQDSSKDNEKPTQNPAQHHHDPLGNRQTQISGHSGADPRNRWRPKLANDKFGGISAVPNSRPVGAASSTTNRMAHLRTTNPFLSDSLD